MSSQEHHALNQVLRDKAPEALQALSHSELQTLTQALQTARRNQRALLQRALEDALQQLPSPLRAALKKLLGL
ncbi:hypothetical protein SAMN04488038_10640 [Solimonas aquatica]|uniref:Uncharacterized protein n=1 Tax=Solimonas aquatica TaxID=489703 RepID=A0A1H9FMZ3_9GAMM|nr:hypothetical protein [Solimonas aquatica]SEQ39360.1 hypothetical protein SAMN04488038_10640 [Solimonas aquatica]